jgi:hypothetical protein
MGGPDRGQFHEAVDDLVPGKPNTQTIQPPEPARGSVKLADRPARRLDPSRNPVTTCNE